MWCAAIIGAYIFGQTCFSAKIFNWIYCLNKYRNILLELNISAEILWGCKQPEGMLITVHKYRKMLPLELYFRPKYSLPQFSAPYSWPFFSRNIFLVEFFVTMLMPVCTVYIGIAKIVAVVIFSQYTFAQNISSIFFHDYFRPKYCPGQILCGYFNDCT